MNSLHVPPALVVSVLLLAALIILSVVVTGIITTPPIDPSDVPDSGSLGWLPGEPIS